MDPMAVLSAVWRYRSFVLPALIITLVAAIYVFQFGPRTYESSMSYALVNPKLPTDQEIAADPLLGQLNMDNPYLRSSDSSLVTDVLITKLNSSSTSELLSERDLGSEYTVGAGATGNGFVVEITGVGDSPEQAVTTTKALGALLVEDLRSIQKVNDADDRFLFTALVVSPPDAATEQFSSRLRAVIIVFLGGAVLVFASVSLARAMEASRLRRARHGASKVPAHGHETTNPAEHEPARSAAYRQRTRRPTPERSVHEPQAFEFAPRPEDTESASVEQR